LLGRLAFSNGNKIYIDTGFMWHILACPARGWPSPRKHGNLLYIIIQYCNRSLINASHFDDIIFA
jgi:hypothetical protein